MPTKERLAAKGSLAILSLGFGLLILLVALLGISARRALMEIHRDVAATQSVSRAVYLSLASIEDTVYESAILRRDHLIWPEEIDTVRLGSELSRMKDATLSSLNRLDSVLRPLNRGAPTALRERLEAYWTSVDAARRDVGPKVGRTTAAEWKGHAVPRRLAVLEMTKDIAHWNDLAMRSERERLERTRARQALILQWTMAGALALAATIAAFSVGMARHLETRTDHQRRRAEGAEQELRRLSQQLVHAHEEERKALSRELHDEIGQKLTAIRLELGRLERSRAVAPARFQTDLAETKALVEESIRAVRDLAMGLRPSMLDDLGLEPALGWQIREFSRRTGVPVRFQYVDDAATLPDRVCTCLYRVAQEALTNCARHAGAKNVGVSVGREPSFAVLVVEDDGIGFDASSARAQGLGLVGMEERVRELGGMLEITSSLHLGTRLVARVPVDHERAQA